jgi:hypothetical protein
MSVLEADSSNHKGKRKAEPTPLVETKSKKSKEICTESVDLAKAYGWALKNMAMSWIYNDDGACFMDVCTKEVNVVGAWMVIYQPHKSMIKYDDFDATIIIKRIDKVPVTKKMFTSAIPHIKLVEKLYLESYNDILTLTGNKWTHQIDGTFKELAQIQKPIAFKDGQIKMQFEIRMPTNHSCGDSWIPVKLLEWLGEPTEYNVLDQDEIYKFTKPAKPAII